MKDGVSRSRRALLRNSLMGVAALVGSTVLPAARSLGSSPPRVSEDDPAAKALKYRHNAAESERQNADEYCYNCRYYRGGRNDEWAPCDLFPGKVVAGNGWCNVWAKKG